MANIEPAAPVMERPVYIREYRIQHITKDGQVKEYIKKRTIPVPGTGGARGRPKISDETVARIKQLRADRYTLKQIHEMTGVSLSIVGKIAHA
jgi:hypothetical protein